MQCRGVLGGGPQRPAGRKAQPRCRGRAPHPASHYFPPPNPSTQPLEPILVPKLRIHFADFPYLHSSIKLEALDLGDLLRFSVRLGARARHAPGFSRTRAWALEPGPRPSPFRRCALIANQLASKATAHTLARKDNSFPSHARASPDAASLPTRPRPPVQESYPASFSVEEGSPPPVITSFPPTSTPTAPRRTTLPPEPFPTSAFKTPP